MHAIGMPGTLFAPPEAPDDLSQPGLEFTLPDRVLHFALPQRVLHFSLVDDDA